MFDYASFYKGKRVLLTGHTGFKGSWMLAALHKFGAKVLGYSLAPNTTPSMFEKIGGDKLCTSIIGDISDYDKLLKAFTDFQPEIVIHMAAQPIVLESYKAPVWTYQTNVMGTVNVLEAVRHTKSVRSFVNVTTDKVYENLSLTRGYVETDALGGYDPYSNSKACSELVTKAYRSSFFNPEKFAEHGVSISTCRAGNVLGGGDWADNRLIPDCVRYSLKGEPIIIRNPKAVRPWEHVMEPVFQYLKLAALQYNNVSYAGHYNIGPEVSHCKPVLDILQLFVKYFPGATYEIHENPNAPHEASLLMLNIDKSKEVLGFRPRYSADDTIRVSVEWYTADARGEDMLAVTLRQIEDFLQ
ncbi:MAG: CDP-glucose 4,6-dehydratase [Clostridiales bacterium]|nr:CDP-glucose 4,6-dehydratase [Clostridiales bacterium]